VQQRFAFDRFEARGTTRAALHLLDVAGWSIVAYNTLEALAVAVSCYGWLMAAYIHGC